MASNCLYRNKYSAHTDRFEINCYDSTTGLPVDCSTCESCPDYQTDCRESQEWTYAIDNTGTQTNEDATLTLTLSDGSTLVINQTNQGALSQWTPQIQEWGDEIQSAAESAGLAWFVETRCILGETNPSGCGGFSGPPSEPVGIALWAGGIRARYVNIQICPGQPVPVSAVYNSATRPNLEMTTAGAVLGPINKFKVCVECDAETDVWYIFDKSLGEYRLANAGEIPNCWEPCGTLSLAPAPPDRDCEFFIDLACDDNGDNGNQAGYTNQITRRATVCNGEQIALEYFVEDPNDPTALVEYELVGDFVDCATGEPVPVPEPNCERIGVNVLCFQDTVEGELVKKSIKEICYDGCPSIYQDSEGNVVDITELTPCADDSADFEIVRECRNGFITIVNYLTDDTGIAEISATITDESCITKYPKDACYIDPETPNGIVGKRWDSELNAAAFDTNTSTFPTWDTHINGTPDEEVIITNNWSLNDLDFPLTGAYDPANGDRDISSQELYYAWLNVTETIKLRDTNGNTGEYISIFVEDCNKDMVQVVKDKFTTGASRNAGEFLTLCPGIHKIAIQISDYSVYGGFKLQYSSDDGATWAAFPMSDTYSAPPNIITTCVLFGEDGSITNIDGTSFLFETIPCSPPCYPLTREELPDTEVSIVDGCDDIDGDPANYVNVTREVIFEGGESTTTYYTNYGDDNLQQEYTIQGGFVDCATGEPIEEPVVPPPCENWAVIDVYKPIGVKGVNVERWVTNAITGENSATQAGDIFVGDTDYSGMPAHDNGVPDGPIVIESDLRILDNVNGQDQFRYWTYLYITESIRLRELLGRAESVDYYLGECCGEPILAASGNYPNTTGSAFDVTLEPGIHYIGGTVNDFSAYSGVNYQYSVDNGTTWRNVPAAWLYATKPTIEQCPAKVCIETGICADLKTGLELGSEVTLCKPSLCSGSADPVVVQCAPQTFYKVVLGEVGTVEQKWTTSAVQTSNAAGHSYRDAFTGVDADGLPAHPNAPDTTISSTIASTTNVLQQDSPEIDDQAQSDFWIYLPTDATLREFNATAEAVGVFISDRCGLGALNEKLDAPYLNSGPNDLGLYQSGWYKVRLYHHDVTANGVARLQADFGDGFVNIPAYLTAPTVEIIKGWYCDDGSNYNQDKSETLDDTWACDDPRCSASTCCNSGGGETTLPQTIRIIE